jgi:hypothetical protein
MEEKSIIIYNTKDGKASVSLLTKDGTVWMNQSQLAELFDSSVPNISMHISNILNENELIKNSVVKDYLSTDTDGKEYNVTFYSPNGSGTTYRRNATEISAVGFLPLEGRTSRRSSSISKLSTN